MLSPVGSPTPDAVLTNPSFRGVVVRQQWSAIAASSDLASNNYQFLRSELDRATAANKKVSLIVSWAGEAAPNWLPSRNVSTFSFINPNPFQPDTGTLETVPVPWDRDYAIEVARFVTDMGSAISGHSALAIVNTHCVSASTPDWFLPIDSTANINTMIAAGYTNSGLLTSCKAIIDATMRAFPNQVVTMAFGQLPSSLTGQSSGDYLAREIVTYVRQTWPGRTFYAMRWNLNTVTPDPRTTADLGQGWSLIDEQRRTTSDRIYPAAQWVWPASDVTTCRANGNRSPCEALTNLRVAGEVALLGYEMPYVEVYGADATNPALAAELARLATLVRVP